MKEYKEYMDRVEVSDTLRARLLALGETAPPKKKPVWRKYGALAAALALVVGLGLAGYAAITSAGADRWRETGGELIEGFTPNAATDIATAPAIGEGSGEDGSFRTIGGFEVAHGEGPEAAVAYYILPWIGYGEEASSAQVAADFATPDGCVTRDLTQEDILALFGGEEVLTTMLDWGDFELEGRVIHQPDGAVWTLILSGRGEGMHFSLAMAPDALPLTCVVVSDDFVTEIWGVEVSGRRAGIHGEGPNREVWLPESREVSFVAKGVGCRFTLYGMEGESEAVETMVSRFVRQAIAGEGIHLSAVGPDGVLLPEESGPADVPSDPGTGGGASTPAYDPGASRSPEN